MSNQKMMRRAIFGLLLALLAIGEVRATSNYQQDILSQSSLISLWKFDEAASPCTTLHDSSSNAYTATLTGSGATCGVTALEGGGSPPTAISVTNAATWTTNANTGSSAYSNIDYNKGWCMEVLVKVPSGALPSSGNAAIAVYELTTGSPHFTSWYFGVENIDGTNVRVFFSPTTVTGVGGTFAAQNSPNLVGTSPHHIGVCDNGGGTGTSSDFTFYQDGAAFPAVLTGGSNPGAASWNGGTSVIIAEANNSTAVTWQDLALYSVNGPEGSTSRLGPSSNFPLDIALTYHSLFYQNNGSTLSAPAQNQKIMFEKDCSDADDWITFQILADGVYRNANQLLSMASNARNVACASAFRALLHYWALDGRVPVGAYQGTNTAYGNTDDGFGNVETDFRPWDKTDVGITAWTIGNAGTGYNVGDIVQLGASCGGTNCGTLETNDTTQRQQWKVLTTTAGANTGIATMREYWGSTLAQMTQLSSYSTAPNCTSACTLTSLSGGGSGATLSAVTTNTDRGNYPDAEWLWADIIAANSGVWLANGGQSAIDQLLVTNHLSTLNANVAGIILMQCNMPTSAYWSTGLEYNCSQVPSDWNNLASNYTGPRVYSGVENTNPVAGGSVPFPSQGWIYGGFVNTLNAATVPGEDGMKSSSQAVAAGHGGSSCSSFPAAACYRTYWDLWTYWFQYAYQGLSGKGGWMVVAGGNNATQVIGAVTGCTVNNNCFNATPSGNAWYLRRTQESALVTDIATIMAESPGTFLGGGGLLLRGMGMNDPANDNEPSSKFMQALYSEWDSALVAAPSFRSKRLAMR